MKTSLTTEISKANQILGDKVLDFLFRTLAIDQEWSFRDKTGFTWWAHRLPQRVWFEPLWVEDGSAYIRIHAETLGFRYVPNTLETVHRLDALNRFPSMNAFTWNSNTGRISSHFCAYVTDETFGWLKQVLVSAISLQVVEAHAKAIEATARVFNAELDESNHPQSGKRHSPDDMLAVIENEFAPAGNHPLTFSENDFKRILQIEPHPWILASADDSGLTAEFAFEGIMPAVASDFVDGPVQTTLFQVSTKEQHPQLGTGVLLRMTLPNSLTQEQAIAKAHELNQAETHEHTLSYFMGAWRSASPIEATYTEKGGLDLIARIIARQMKRPEEACKVAELIEQAVEKKDSPLTNLCFITFLPALISKNADILEPLVWSMAARSRWVKQHLSWH